MGKDGFTPFSLSIFYKGRETPASTKIPMKKVLTLLIALIALPILAAAQNSDGFIPIPSDKIEVGDDYSLLTTYGYWTPASLSSDNETFINIRKFHSSGKEATVTLYDKKLDKTLEFTQPEELYYSLSYSNDNRAEENYGGIAYTEFSNPSKDLNINFFASQTLFNDDSNFEFVMFTFGDDWQTTDTGNGTLRLRGLTGFQIINDKNEIISEIKFDESVYDRSLDFTAYVYEIDDYRYMEVYGHYYLIDKKTSSLKSVKMPDGLRALPSIARHHEDIAVDFEASSSTRVLHLVDANGRTVLSDKIPAGTTNHKISSGTLSSGLYIVTLSDGTSTTETTKIIIR